MRCIDDHLRVLVCGGANGVGLACAEAFAALGAELILCDHDGNSLTHAALRLGAFSRYCDAIADNSVAVFAAEMTGKYPAIDVLINAAGQGYVRALAMTRMTRALLPLLRRATGRRLVVNIAAAGGFRPTDGIFPYASSMPAFERLSDALAAQVKGTGIGVVSVTPSIARPRSARVARADHLYEFQRIDAADTARRIVDLVAAERPEWRFRPPSAIERA
jgi:3-hydroxybutyrate dehydrogenase